MYHFIYETTNLINGNKYIGKHSTSNLNDGYLGSGMLLIKAIQKYGKENFSVKILEFSDSMQNLSDLERKYITEEIVSSYRYYNIALGGHGGKIALYKENPDYQKIREKISDTQKRLAKDISKRVTEQHRKSKELNIDYAMKGKKQSEKQRNFAKKLGSRERSPEEVEKLKLSQRKTFDNPNYVHPNTNNKIHKIQLSCVFCRRIYDVGNFIRWHFDKCEGI